MRNLILFLLFTTFLNSQTWQELTKESDKLLQERKFEEALSKSNQALKQVTELYGDNNEYQATQYGKIGRIYYYWGKYELALEFYEKEKLLIESTRGKNNISYARALNNLGIVYNALGQINNIEINLKESIEIKKSILGENDTSYAKSLNNLGKLYIEKGKYPEAENLLRKSLNIKINSTGQNSYSTGMSYLNLGNLYNSIGNKEKALESYESAYNALKNSLVPSHPDRQSAVFQLATLYSIEGDTDKAKSLMIEAEKAISKNPESINFETANTIYNLAQLKIRLEKFNEAKQLLIPIMEPFEKNVGAGHPLFSKLLNSAGIVSWITGDLDNAFNYLSENKDITRQLYGQYSKQYGESCSNLAGLLKDLEYYEEADEIYNEAFAIYLYQIENYFPHYSEQEKTQFYRMVKERFEMFNSYVIQRQIDNPRILGDMYNYQVATKGILLDYSKNIAGLVEKSGNKALIEKYSNWIQKKQQMATLFNKSKLELQRLNIDLEKIEQEANLIEKEISVEISELSPNLAKIPKWQEIQKSLKSNEAALEIIRFRYFGKGWADSTFYAALILTSETVNHPEIVLLENGNVLDGTLLRRYKKTVKAKFPDKRTYKFYWEKIDDRLNNKDVVYISADGAFNLINIASIMKPDGTFLLEEKTFIHLNNTKNLINRSKLETKANKLYLFGNPDYDLKNQENISETAKKLDEGEKTIITPLPGTQIEIEKIASILEKQGKNFVSYINDDASETNFKQVENAKLIHIATHGYFLSDVSEISGEKVFGVDIERAEGNPLLRAGLLFSGASSFLNFDASADDENNGIITAYEVKNMDLRETELVVLSACETGLGEVMNGEGVYGLQRAFQVAGAKAIIMSLWTVDDKTTQELMVEFYKNYFSGKPVIDSFREARLYIKDKYQDPYYWGAFKLLGGL